MMPKCNIWMAPQPTLEEVLRDLAEQRVAGILCHSAHLILEVRRKFKNRDRCTQLSTEKEGNG